MAEAVAVVAACSLARRCGLAAVLLNRVEQPTALVTPATSRTPRLRTPGPLNARAAADFRVELVKAPYRRTRDAPCPPPHRDPRRARHGKPGSISGHELTDVDLDTVRFSIGSLGLGTNLDVWDETRGGAKVLNIHWDSNDAIEVVSFRRGDWEQVLLDRAKRLLN
jgi:hypothetical protein